MAPIRKPNDVIRARTSDALSPISFRGSPSSVVLVAEEPCAGHCLPAPSAPFFVSSAAVIPLTSSPGGRLVSHTPRELIGAVRLDAVVRGE